jgi:hypothetical protein
MHSIFWWILVFIFGNYVLNVVGMMRLKKTSVRPIDKYTRRTLLPLLTYGESFQIAPTTVSLASANGRDMTVALEVFERGKESPMRSFNAITRVSHYRVKNLNNLLLDTLSKNNVKLHSQVLTPSDYSYDVASGTLTLRANLRVKAKFGKTMIPSAAVEFHTQRLSPQEDVDIIDISTAQKHLVAKSSFTITVVKNLFAASPIDFIADVSVFTDTPAALSDNPKEYPIPTNLVPFFAKRPTEQDLQDLKIPTTYIAADKYLPVLFSAEPTFGGIGAKSGTHPLRKGILVFKELRKNDKPCELSVDQKTCLQKGVIGAYRQTPDDSPTQQTAHYLLLVPKDIVFDTLVYEYTSTSDTGVVRSQSVRLKFDPTEAVVAIDENINTTWWDTCGTNGRRDSSHPAFQRPWYYYANFDEYMTIFGPNCHA